MTGASIRPNTILNTAALGKLASSLLETLRKQRTQLAPLVADLAGKGRKLFDGAIKVGRSHSGSNFGYHSALYYRDFETPSLGAMFNVEWGGTNGIAPGWSARDADEVKARIEKLASQTFAETEETLKTLLNDAKELLKELLIQLAPLHQLPDGNRERSLLDELEHFDWEDSAHKKYCAQAMQNFPSATRDSGAFHQGMIFPAHSYYEANAYQVEESCEAIEGFWNSADRLLRQLELAATQELVKDAPAAPGNETSIAAKYERLRIVVAILGALLLSLLIAGSAELATRRFHWKWLLNHPNSYAIQGLSYAVLLLFLIGLFVGRFRKFCWSIALLPLLVAVLQSLGGPPSRP